MNRIALILPYYGNYPNYMKIWLHTAAANPSIDFLLFSDKCPDEQCPENLIWHKLKFDEFVALAQKCFDFKITLNTPYKLCDYKPAYGMILKKYLVEYDFWGHCDPDIVWGNFQHFLTEEVLREYDRIYTRGHLSIYRNSEKMNTLFMKKHAFRDCYSYRYVFSTDFGCAFDEWGTKYGYGVSTLFKRWNVKTYDEIDFADIAYGKFPFSLAVNDGFNPCIFEWNNNGLFGFKNENGEVKKKEYLYLHLQKRAMKFDSKWGKKELSDFIIVPNQFVSKNVDTKIELYLKEIPEKKFYPEWYKKRIQRFFQKMKQGALQQLIYRKLCVLKIVKYKG